MGTTERTPSRPNEVDETGLQFPKVVKRDVKWPWFAAYLTRGTPCVVAHRPEYYRALVGNTSMATRAGLEQVED